ncbi:hypothetical protein EUGRSUZ_H01848 [Eucalyptus grandis]|uniref:Uncharacterized protein n=2 Tax=Eucalyptus grandis TaxID=71139 RepID=A0A059B0I9_EUCGR|nr:hypothetical protein EUGRSUZ_H01848 [Eucalyptus grandis]
MPSRLVLDENCSHCVWEWKNLIEPNKSQKRHRAWGKLPSVFGNLSNSCYVPFEKDVREWVTTWILYFLEERFYAGLSKVECPVSFWVPQHLHADVLGLTFCVAFELKEGIQASLSCEVRVLVDPI